MANIGNCCRKASVFVTTGPSLGQISGTTAIEMATAMSAPIRTLKEFEAAGGLAKRARQLSRSVAIGALSVSRSPVRSSGWIRFPYYHHVFDDERTGFSRQLTYFRSVGDIIGLDDAVSMIDGSVPIDGRYFCLTFDDGFKNWVENALPILIEKDAVAAFFLATDYIGTDPVRDRERLMAFYEDGRRLMAFLDWEDCRSLAAAGMTVGSHAKSHRRLSSLSADDARLELADSKTLIERELSGPCDHFCAPFGIPGQDFDPGLHPAMAAELGYKSFLTTRRGANGPGQPAFAIKRDHMMANAPLHEVKYFMGDSPWAWGEQRA